MLDLLTPDGRFNDALAYITRRHPALSTELNIANRHIGAEISLGRHEVSGEHKIY